VYSHCPGSVLLTLSSQLLVLGGIGPKRARSIVQACPILSCVLAMYQCANQLICNVRSIKQLRITPQLSRRMKASFASRTSCKYMPFSLPAPALPAVLPSSVLHKAAWPSHLETIDAGQSNIEQEARLLLLQGLWINKGCHPCEA
jgi:hypothetical protein